MRRVSRLFRGQFGDPGELPNLSKMIEPGVHANLVTVESVHAPSVWTSTATDLSVFRLALSPLDKTRYPR